MFFSRLSLPENNQIRIRLGEANSLGLFSQIVEELKNKYLPFHQGLEVWPFTTEEGSQNLILPPWLCQSYVRRNVEDHKKKVEENSESEDISVSKMITFLINSFLYYINFRIPIKDNIKMQMVIP